MTVYLLHFEEPIGDLDNPRGQARHYLGYTDDLEQRLQAHRFVIELFRANHDNWGYILALRTGPGDFNKIWAAHSWNGGCLPADVALKDGYLWRGGKPVTTPSENEFFAAIGLPCWQPEERSAIHLAKYLINRRKVSVSYV